MEIWWDFENISLTLVCLGTDFLNPDTLYKTKVELFESKKYVCIQIMRFFCKFISDETALIRILNFDPKIFKKI